MRGNVTEFLRLDRLRSWPAFPPSSRTSPTPALAAQSVPDDSSARPFARVRVAGKFLFVGDRKFHVRGVTYGPFRPGARGNEFDPRTVERDFAQIASCGFNSVRVYTTPPRWLLDAAQRHGLRVMVGIPWEQHITFLDDRRRREEIEDRVRQAVRGCAHHPAVLCYAVGNEISASIIRWYGNKRVERFIRQLYEIAKSEDPGSIVTYVNFPSTEYLHLPFLDFVCFNVYLESRRTLESYLSHLQVLADDRPLIMGEIGLDSMRNGEERQAQTLEWQIRSAFASGVAGCFVFAWTDEWYRGGLDIDDWQFGLARRDRSPKAALDSVRRAFAQTPFPIAGTPASPAPAAADRRWPMISVVVCSYNGSRTLAWCLDGIGKLEYPDYEVIVVNDGSTDATAAIAATYDCRLISIANRGLSNARNVGMVAARGQIVAYLDDDARPDPHWLQYLAHTFASSDHAAVGGPNIVPADEHGLVESCVTRAPGGPTHVLLTDAVAEHIPGCNMAFRRDKLLEIGGFDPQFRIAGDDVDLCWRIQQHGWTIGFNPAAMVWHRRRNRVRMFWKQQFNYGKAEAMLERKWPDKYNAAGHLRWAGRIYGAGGLLDALRWTRSRIYHGTWNSALFQSVYHTAPGVLTSLPTMPEWYLVIAALTVALGLSAIWPLLLVIAGPLLLLTIGTSIAQAAVCARRSGEVSRHGRVLRSRRADWLTFGLHLMQPAARLLGRLGRGLTPWRHRGGGHRRLVLPTPRRFSIWDEKWSAPEARLQVVEAKLQHDGAVVRRGGHFDDWDLEIRGGLFGAARIRMGIEEHGQGRQLVRLRVWPRCNRPGVMLLLFVPCLAIVADATDAWHASAPLWFAVIAILVLAPLRDLSAAMEAAVHVLAPLALAKPLPSRRPAAPVKPTPSAEHDPANAQVQAGADADVDADADVAAST